MDNDQTTTRHHVLLIGIDAYAVKPLSGCVNDVDAVQRLLLSPRTGISPTHVTRLASPRPGTTHETAIESAPATLANMRVALERLGSSDVERGDRVFIFYSGHGLRVPVATPDGVFHREALVPVDVGEEPGTPRLLLDVELNRLLAAIAARTSAVTLVLECCHAAGATRDDPGAGVTARVLDYYEAVGSRRPLPLAVADAARAATEVRGFGGSVDDCHVIAACHDHECAYESAGDGGVHQGHLTRAILEELAVIGDDHLLDVTWARIWQGVRARVLAGHPAQHVWMAGEPARALFGGPRPDGDPGLGITRDGGVYRIDAGSLAAVTAGAEIAVYGELPLRFAPLGSASDLQARATTISLKVTAAQPSWATAVASGQPFELPPGARGRLVDPGEPARLRCAVVPDAPGIVEVLASSRLVEVVGERDARVVFRQREARWELTDDLHRLHPDAPALCTLDTKQFDLAARVAEQYFYYALPIRMAESCRDFPGELSLTVHHCPLDRPLTDAEQDGVGLAEATGSGGFPYALRLGDRVAFRVRNRSPERLKVTLLNAAASGRVEYLADQVIDAGGVAIFWRDGNRGRPFPGTLPAGVTDGIDRLIAVGTTVMTANLRYLTVDSRFSEILARKRGQVAKELSDDEVASPPIERWAACHTVVRCRV